MLWECANWWVENAACTAVQMPIASRLWLTDCLASLRPKLGRRAIRSARASVNGSSWSRETTSFTIPRRHASWAGIGSPVNSICLALRAPTSKGCTKYSMPLTPKETTGSENSASSLATIRSQGHTNIKPPAITLPCTWAMVGLGMLRQRQHRLT